MINRHQYEYKQDRLNREILDLKFEIDQMKMDYEKQRSDAMVIKIIICITVFMVGYVLGRFW